MLLSAGQSAVNDQRQGQRRILGRKIVVQRDGVGAIDTQDDSAGHTASNDKLAGGRFKNLTADDAANDRVKTGPGATNGSNARQDLAFTKATRGVNASVGMTRSRHRCRRPSRQNLAAHSRSMPHCCCSKQTICLRQSRSQLTMTLPTEKDRPIAPLRWMICSLRFPPSASSING